jgi:hypothetical protein
MDSMLKFVLYCSYVPHPASIKYATEVYKNQPGRIEDYEPGHSSISEKETKQVRVLSLELPFLHWYLRGSAFWTPTCTKTCLKVSEVTRK